MPRHTLQEAVIMAKEYLSQLRHQSTQDILESHAHQRALGGLVQNIALIESKKTEGINPDGSLSEYGPLEHELGVPEVMDAYQEFLSEHDGLIQEANLQAGFEAMGGMSKSSAEAAERLRHVNDQMQQGAVATFEEDMAATQDLAGIDIASPHDAKHVPWTYYEKLLAKTMKLTMKRKSNPNPYQKVNPNHVLQKSLTNCPKESNEKC